MTTRALVLGAGGNAGIAWEVGVIAGVAEAGIDLSGVDVVIGTSAGSVVGAQLATGLSPADMLRRQVDPRLQSDEIAPSIDFRQWRAELERVKQSGDADTRTTLRRIGSFALAVPSTSGDARRQVIASRLPSGTWPATRLLIVAVNVSSGERRVFESSSGVPLQDAVAASCAVPGIWPVVHIDGEQYMDGGSYSLENADLAAGYDRVLVVSLPAAVPPISLVAAEGLRQELRGAQVVVVQPDELTQAAFASVGGNLLDPTVRTAAANAGREQGRRFALRDAAGIWT
jgi:NTE family protein